MKIRIPGIKLLGKAIYFIRNIRKITKEKLSKSVRFQLIVAFAISLIGSMIVYGICNSVFKNQYADISYSSSINQIDDEAKTIVNQLDNVSNKGVTGDSVYTDPDLSKDPVEFLRFEEENNRNLKILVVDLDGQVIFKSENATETKVDLYSIIRNAMNIRINSYNQYDAYNTDSGKEFVSFYPVNFQSKKAYVMVSGIPKANIVYISGSDSFLALLAGIASFVLFFILLTNKKMKYLEELAGGLLEISKGNLDFRVEKKGQDELGSLADNINYMAEELRKTIEEERKAEKTKNELITNVSHDLRTPLTSIMGYLRLLKDKKYENEDQIEDYINIAYGKSEKLRVLIEDLFEYTKLTNQGLDLTKEKVNINELIEQLMEELVPICEENNLIFVKEIPQDKLIVNVNPDKIVRVFENLLMNAIKYSDQPGFINVKVYKEEDKLAICIINKGEHIPEKDLPRLFDRFYTVDKSRTSDKGGSGLGLAISKNIIELHGGKIWAECNGNEIRFVVKLELVKE